MKNRYPLVLCAALRALAILAALGGCDTGAVDGPFLLDFPPLPPSWTELLGSPRWLVRYYSAGGREESLEVEGETAGLSLPLSRVSPVLAWPYWPARRLKPGDFRPAGAILPYQVRGGDPGRISLSWQGGVEAWFFQALNRAALNKAALSSAALNGTEALEDPRRAENFDWPGFGALFSDPGVSAEFRSDPWLADWDAIAERTLRSGFRKQWLVPGETRSLIVPVPPGLWVSPSPFVPPLEAGAEPSTLIAPPGPRVQAWYSAGGILHCAGTSWILLPWAAPWE
jgi:hypothetical protein